MEYSGTRSLSGPKWAASTNSATLRLVQAEHSKTEAPCALGVKGADYGPLGDSPCGAAWVKGGRDRADRIITSAVDPT